MEVMKPAACRVREVGGKGVTPSPKKSPELSQLQREQNSERSPFGA